MLSILFKTNSRVVSREESTEEGRGPSENPSQRKFFEGKKTELIGKVED